MWTDYNYCGNQPSCYQRRRRAYAWRDFKFIGLYLFSPCAAVAFLALANILWNDGGEWIWIFFLAGALAALLFVSLFFSAQKENRVARIVPCFDKRLENAGTWLEGKQLAAHCRQADVLAMKKGVRAVSHFGFADDFEGEEPQWHAAADGVATMQTLLDHWQKDEELSSAAGLGEELAAIIQALQHAVEKESKFCLIILLGKDMSAQKRKGSLW